MGHASGGVLMQCTIPGGTAAQAPGIGQSTIHRPTTENCVNGSHVVAWQLMAAIPLHMRTP